jgi:hypothetical protein
MKVHIVPKQHFMLLFLNKVSDNINADLPLQLHMPKIQA